MKKSKASVVLVSLFWAAGGLAKNSLAAMTQPPTIIERRGGAVSVVKYSDGAWDLQVGSEPYFVKGVVFTPVKIGESPEEGTMRDWMLYDDDHDGRNDVAYQTWLFNDPTRKPLGDFQLLKSLGANTIRLYHEPSDNPMVGLIYKEGNGIPLLFDHAINKALLRSLFKDYGIRVILGNYLGSWTIGSGATWDAGTDYENREERENIKKSVRAMVLDNKDEPYVLLWMLGNENNIADWSQCNAKQKPEAYAKLVGELADMIHHLDPNHPVAICDGDDAGRMMPYYAKFAKGIDIIGYNAYRGPFGFGTLWRAAHNGFDRPILITEFGTPAYNQKRGEDEAFQEQYISRAWKDIVRQSRPYRDLEKGQLGVSIGGTVFDWVDRWYLDGRPSEHNSGSHPDPNAPDKIMHQEYFGLTAMDSGTTHDSLMRRPRKAYESLKRVWNQPDLR